MHNEITQNAKIQVSVQINEVLLYNKSKKLEINKKLIRE